MQSAFVLAGHRVGKAGTAQLGGNSLTIRLTPCYARTMNNRLISFLASDRFAAVAGLLSGWLCAQIAWFITR